jgi:hypothetical protein
VVWGWGRQEPARCFLAGILVLVAYLTVTRADRIKAEPAL